MLPELFRLIGSDRYLAPEDVVRAAGPHPATAAVWDVYRSHFGGFTGATLDPSFHRLSHPATASGRVHLDPGTTVVVVGTDESLSAQLDELVRVRQHVRIFTSAGGAARLGAHGLRPDLIVAEHEGAHGTGRASSALPLVAADWRTSSIWLSSVPQDQLFVPAPLPSWGLWQATAVAIAIEAKAARVALLGVDAEVADAVSLRALLELLARIAPFTALDCCAEHAPKRGWVGAAIGEVAGKKLSGPLEISRWSATSRDEREQQARTGLEELAPLLGRARRLLAVAEETRTSEARSSMAALDAAADELMGWRQDVRLRILVQECLCAAELARVWRTGIDRADARMIRDRVERAMRDVIGQADVLAAAVGRRRAA